MAKPKWNPFGAPQPAASQSEPVKPQLVQITPADGKRFGLENFGNICYANSVLQALYFCSPFRELLLQSPDPSLLLPQKSAPVHTAPPPLPSTSPARHKPVRKHSHTSEPSNPNGIAHSSGPSIPSSPATLFSALRSLFLHISENPSDKGTIAPRAFIDKLKDVNTEFRNTNHQDAHEFLNFLLNKIVEEMEEERKHQANTPSKEDLSNSIGTLVSPTIVTATTSSNSGTSPQDATLVHKLFEGVLTSETRCLTCETVSSRDESFLDLSIDIEKNSSVTACLRQFSASEMLCQKNKFFCDSCCDLQEAEKRMKIKKLPNVLALHLKRFKYQEDVQRYIKLAYRVAFPFELRLFNTVDDAQDPDRLYELFAIVVHIGNGPHHGHYVTIIRTPATWLIFDDDTVEPIKESEITKYFGESNSGSAYVLYYQAVDLDLAALGLRSASPPVAVADVKDTAPEQLTSLEPPASPAVPVPSLPPGLADEPDSSDVSDQAFPITPPQTSQPSPTAPFAGRVPPKHSPPLTINISSPEDNANLASGVPGSPATTASSSTGAKAGLFQSLRHSPSIKRGGHAPSSSTVVERRRSVREMMRPSTSPGLPKHPEPTVEPPIPVVPALSPTPAPAIAVPDEPQPEKMPERTPERKPSTWFKRMSGKRPGTATGVSSSTQSAGDIPPAPSINWLRNSPQAVSSPESANDRRPSEPAALYDVGSWTSGGNSKKSFHSPKSSVDYSITPLNGSGDRKGSQESPSSGSASSFPSTGVPLADSPAPIAPKPLPTIPASPQGPSIPAIRQPIYAPPSSFSPLPHPPVDHKRSQPQLTVTKPKFELSPESPKLPPRPSTAGATSGEVDLSEAPPLPPLPTFNRTHRRGGSNDQHSDATLSSEGRPGSTYVTGDFTPIDSTPFDTASNVSAPLKRASRKLSLSSPILGFGRKEKKEKTPTYEKVSERNAKELEKAAKSRAKVEKAREKARQKEENRKREEEELALAPSAFPTFAMMGRA